MFGLGPFGLWKLCNRGLRLYRRHLEKKVAQLQAQKLPKEAAELDAWAAEVRASGDRPISSPTGLWSGRELKQLMASPHGEVWINAIKRAQMNARLQGESK